MASTCDEAAIRTQYQIQPEVYKGFFRGLLGEDDGAGSNGATFAHWQDGRSRFHLRYFGGPGSGKTTFTSLAAEALRAKYESSPRDIVAKIFVSEGIEWSELMREQALEAILVQLCPPSTCPVLPIAYTAFVEMCRQGESLSARIGALRLALDARLAELDRAFVLIDGLDRCGPSWGLEKEMLRFGPQVKMLSTSRAGAPEMDEFLPWWWPSGQVFCDGKECTDKSAALEMSVYWMCTRRHKAWILCWACSSKGDVCTECKDRKHLKQTPQVCVNLNGAFEQQFRAYMDWEMDREHGLRSETPGIPPCQSKLGKWLSPENKSLARERRMNPTSLRLGNNIAIARLRMEILHAGEGAVKMDEGLPREIVTMFDAIVGTCSEFGIRVIAAASKLQTPYRCATVAAIRSVLGLGPGKDHDTLCRLLRAAKGVLVAIRGQDEELGLGFYTGAFKTYAGRDYNTRLQKAQAKLFSAQGGVEE